MRVLALVLAGAFLLDATPATAGKKHDWQDGTLVDITDDAPGATQPGAETAWGYHIKRAYYWIRVGSMTYVLVNSWAVGFHSPKAPLNLTLNGKVKVAVEGKNVFLLDDAGKEVKRPLVTKIADAPSSVGATESTSKPE